MKKKLLSVLLAFVFAMGLCVPVFAESDYGNVYDETDELVGMNADAQYFAQEYIPDIVNNYGIDLRVDVLTSIGDFGSALEAGQYLYEEYGYGAGETLEGIGITLLVEEDSDGYMLTDWAIYPGGQDDLIISDGVDTVYSFIESDLDSSAWEGDRESDCFVLSSIITNAAYAVESFALDNDYEPEEPYEEPLEVLPSAAGLNYVNDSCGLLSEDQALELEGKAEALMEEYGHPVYLLILDDYNKYFDVGEPYDAAKEYYFANELGVGSEQEGTILLMSMDNRKMATMHKGYGTVVFTDYGDQHLRDEIKKEFADDKWFEGFERYYDVCDKLLEMAAKGEPLDVDNDDSGRVYGIIACILIALLIALIVVLILKGQLKSVAEKTEAGTYVIDGGVRMRDQYDRYTHTTQTRVYEKPDDDGGSGGGGGGTSVDSDGCSGSSDSF